MSLDKLVNIEPITQPSFGDNLRFFLVWFIAIFNNISVFHCGQFYWWRKSEYPENTTDIPQVTDKLVEHAKLQRTYT
jgi:hypothetical protein